MFIKPVKVKSHGKKYAQIDDELNHIDLESNCKDR